MAIPASELAQIQSDLAAAVCDKACVIERATITRDVYGSEQEAYSAVSPAGLMAGMREPTAGQLQNYDYLIGSLAAWQVHLPWGTDVRVKDHLVIESNTLYVHVLLDPHSVPGLLTVLAAEIK